MKRHAPLAALLIVGLLAGAAMLPASVVAPTPAQAAACEGDECQPPAPPPDDPIPGTAVAEGPSNPPVRFPKAPKQKAHKGKKGHAQRGGRHGQRGTRR